MNHFFSDGIEEPTFLFAFLPLFFANAKNNDLIGLSRALVLLVEMLHMLIEDGMALIYGNGTITVDVQDIASFCKDARHPRIFDTLACHLTFVQHGHGLKATITTKHWNRVALHVWQDDPTQDRE